MSGPPVSDEELSAHLAEADVPALMMTLAHLTGDPSVLEPAALAPGWLFSEQGGLSAAQQEAAREVAFDQLTRLRSEGGWRWPDPPDFPLLREIAGWALGGDVDELLPLLAEEIIAPGADPRSPDWTAPRLAPEREFHVAVIGAGFSGLLAGYRLAQADIPFVIYESATELGGTWAHNTYPGCRTDVASHLYNYSFAPRSDWPEHFCRREVVQDYLREFAASTGVAGRIRFGTEVTELRWDEAEHEWRVQLREGGTARHHAVISAVGQLNRPHVPDIPGRDGFAGTSVHSARWEQGIDVAGKRVGVVGTGASAFQIVPEIAGTAAEVAVFQRHPPWLRPTPNYRSPIRDGARWLFENLPYYARWYRFWLFAPGLRGILEGWVVDPDHPPTERAVSGPNERLRASLSQYLRDQLAGEPELLDAVVPRYPVGAKRVLRDDGRWLTALRRDDVRLVTDPVERVEPRGIVAGGRRHDLDLIVYATGFQASGFLAPMRVLGRGGAEMPARDARAYLGIAMPEFPNLFCMYGPNTNLVGQGGSIVYFSECAAAHIIDAIRLLLTDGKRSMRVRREVHDRFNDRVDAGNRERAWGFSAVGGWYNENGRSATNWPFSALEYWRLTRRADPSDYEFL
ncbi:NAD(P)-binding domain-containing protein [Saccharopolyspora sp. NPDC047091]|uniref:flavin-containing monooxygenase n=1 Tax=Saccharopolyspora sp. NPDC047091 TaxID=3155924 RepID=UPI0033E0B642